LTEALLYSAQKEESERQFRGGYRHFFTVLIFSGPAIKDHSFEKPAE